MGNTMLLRLVVFFSTKVFSLRVKMAVTTENKCFQAIQCNNLRGYFLAPLGAAFYLFSSKVETFKTRETFYLSLCSYRLHDIWCFLDLLQFYAKLCNHKLFLYVNFRPFISLIYQSCGLLHQRLQ